MLSKTSEKSKSDEDTKKIASGAPDRFFSRGVLMGQFAFNRFPEDKEYILKIADLYLTQVEKKILPKLLGHENYKDIEFTPEEAQILYSRANPEFTTGTRKSSTKEPIGFPFLQLYDYIMTFEEVLAQIRGLQVQVNNLDDLGEVSNRDYLRTQIMSDTGMPWSFWDKAEGKVTKIENGRDIYTGLVIGSPTIYDATGLSLEDLRKNEETKKPAIREKNGFEKACDEALYLAFPIQNAIIALGQGLFTCHVTSANCWISDETKVKEGDTPIPTGMWINKMTGPYCFDPVKYKQGELGLLQQKYTNVRQYPWNWPWRKHRDMLNRRDELYGFWDEDMGKQQTELQPFQHGDLSANGLAGGAIGSHLIVVGSGQQVIPAEGKLPYKHNLQDMKDGPMAGFTMNWVREICRNQPQHPIFASPRLSDAWDGSKAWQYLIDHWNRLRRLFSSKQKLSTLGERTDNVFSALNVQDKVLATVSKPVCQKGFLTVFRDYQGKPVSIDKAIYKGDDGKLKLNAAEVDPRQSGCIPEVDAPHLPEHLVIKAIGSDAAQKIRQPEMPIEPKKYGDDAIAKLEAPAEPKPIGPSAPKTLNFEKSKTEDVSEILKLAAPKRRLADNIGEGAAMEAMSVGVPDEQNIDLEKLTKAAELRRPLRQKEETLIMTDLTDSQGRPIYQTENGSLFKLESGQRKWITKFQRDLIV